MAQPWINSGKIPTTGRGSVEFGDLTGGLRLDIPTNNLKPGEFTTAQGVIVSPGGLVRQPPFVYAVPESNDLQPAKSTFTGYARFILKAITSALATIGLLFSSTKVWKITDLSSTALSEVTWADVYNFPVTTGNLTETPATTYANNWGIAGSGPFTWASGAGTLTFNSTGHYIGIDGTVYAVVYSLTNDFFIKVGDTVAFSASDDAGASGSGTVSAVTATVITLTGVTGGTNAKHYRTITVTRVATTDVITGGAQFLDKGIANNTSWVTGIDVPFTKYDPADGTLKRIVDMGLTAATTVYYYPTTLGTTGSPPTATLRTFTAATGSFFKSWMFFGNIKDVDGRHYNRIIWSNPLSSMDDFSSATNFLDINNTEGEIVKLTPLGDYLMCFCSNDIYYGFSVSLPGVPLAFNTLNMRGLGLVGPKAICSAMGGLFFVTYQSIFFMNNLEPIEIGQPVHRVTLRNCAFPGSTQVTHDPANHRIIFAFFDTTSHTGKTMWSFEYRTKAWSQLYLLSQFVDSLLLDNVTNILSTFSNTQYNSRYILLKQGTGDDKPSDVSASSLIRNAETYMEITTGDISLDASDIVKDWFRIEIGINGTDIALVAPNQRIDILVYVAIDGSTTYTGLGNLSIYVGKPNGSLNFKAHGTYARFRMIFAVPTVTGSAGTAPNYVASFTIEQIIFDVKAIAPHQAIK